MVLQSLLAFSHPSFSHFVASVVDISSFLLNTQADYRVAGGGGSSSLLCSQFTGMRLAAFSVAQHISAQTFIIASCLSTLSSIFFSPPVPVEGVFKTLATDLDGKGVIA